MKKFLYAVLFMTSIIFFSPANALTNKTFFACGVNKYIQPGSTIDQVIAACGQPSTQKEYKERNVTKRYETVWHYYFGKFNTYNIAGAPNNAQMRIAFADNKVIGISTNNNYERTPGTATACGYSSNNSRNVNIGDDINTVRLYCGMPRYVTTHYRDIDGPDVDVTELTYKPSPFMPATTLKFKDGALVSIQ